MKKVTYTKLIAEGFQSLGTPFSIDLNQIGLNLIKGLNGKGKSTIFNALLWAEYGENLKTNVATWVDVRTDSFRGTRVVIERTDGEFDYRIARHLDFKGTTLGITGGSTLMMYIKGVDEPAFTKEHQVGSGQHKADMQAMIVDQLGIDSTTFLNSIIFGQRMASLVEADNKDKRDLFERLFAVDFVDKAKEKADIRYKKLAEDIAALGSGISARATAIETAQTASDDAVKLIEEFETNKKTRVKNAQAAVTTMEDRISGNENLNKEDQELLDGLTTDKLETAKKTKKTLDDKLTLLQTNKKDFDKLKTDHETSVKTATNNLAKYKKELEEVKETCPTCSEPIKPEKLAEVKEKIKKSIKAEEQVIKALGTFSNAKRAANEKLIEKTELEIEDSKKEIAKFDNLVADRTKYQTNIDNRTETIAEQKDDLLELQETLKTEKAAKQPALDLKVLAQKVVDLKATQIEETESKATKEVEKGYIDWWIKKGFGVNGIKAFVFNAMLTQLNQYSLKYAARLGFRVEFSIDMTKASKPFQTLIYSGDNVRNYNDLSGGQKQRVDVCIAFAMHDLITENTSFNIFVVDEMTEGMDAAGVEAMFEFIRIKAEDKAVFVITHLDIIDSMGSRIIRVDSDEFGNTVID